MRNHYYSGVKIISSISDQYIEQFLYQMNYMKLHQNTKIILDPPIGEKIVKKTKKMEGVNLFFKFFLKRYNLFGSQVTV